MAATRLASSIFALALLLGSALGSHSDALVWTNDVDTGARLDAWQLDSAVARASTEKPLIIAIVDGFNLAHFSQYANVYTDQSAANNGPLVSAIRAARAYEVLPLGSGHTLSESSDVITLHAKSLADLDERLPSVLGDLSGTAYSAVVTSPEVFQSDANTVRRVKRQSDADGPKEGTKDAKPVAKNAAVKAPPGDQCGLHVNMMKLMVRMDGSTEYICAMPDDMVSKECNAHNATFMVTYTPAKCTKTSATPKASFDSATVSFYIYLKENSFWQLTTLTAQFTNPQNLPKSDDPTDSTNYAARMPTSIGVGSTKRNGFKCGRTDALYLNLVDQRMKAGDRLSVRFDELVVEPFYFNEEENSFNVSSKYHGYGYMDDCVPFFSAASWMGIIIGLLLVAVFLFGVGMLSTLTVMDRFDDPKGKPLQINVKGE